MGTVRTEDEAMTRVQGLSHPSYTEAHTELFQLPLSIFTLLHAKPSLLLLTKMVFLEFLPRILLQVPLYLFSCIYLEVGSKSANTRQELTIWLGDEAGKVDWGTDGDWSMVGRYNCSY